MRIEQRANVSIEAAILAPIAATAAALAVAGLLIAPTGAPVFEAYRLILNGAFGSRLSFSETMTRATPLILTGLAAAVAFRSRLWNIGGEGQFYAGALAAAFIGSRPGLALPAPALISLLTICGMIAGALLLLIPLTLRLTFGVDEVVTTLLFNFVTILFVSMMIEGPLRDPLAFGWPQSVPIADQALLPKLLAHTRLHTGLLIAIGCALLIWLVQAQTVFGLESRAAGLSPPAARFAGVSIRSTLIMVACLSGGLAGLAGAVEVMGIKGYVTTDLSPGYGYTGIIAATLARLHPAGVVAAAVFVATMFIGADAMSRALHVPSYIADVTVALSLLTMLVALFLTNYRVRR